VDDVSYRGLPSVDRLLSQPAIQSLLALYKRDLVVSALRNELDTVRAALQPGSMPPTIDQIAQSVVDFARTSWSAQPVRIINATGVILHTNIGRAPLSEPALDAMREVAAYSDLELDLTSGVRSSRLDIVRRQVTSLTGTQSAHVTVNAASAVLLTLAALARGKEVIVSRGQLVEIGGGFRVPVILRESGARLIEVGTTNRTRLTDYEDAITPRTAAILHVHTANFRIVGFTESVQLQALARLAHAHNLLMISDNGSGALLDTEGFGLAHEPTVQEAIEAGCDIVAFSGDKLLGGPQSGILVGPNELIARLARHPLARAVRPDKITLAALSATLLSYMKDDAVRTIPVWRMIAETAEHVESRAVAWQERAQARGITVVLIPGESTIGGGSLPTECLPTTLMQLPSSISAKRLRAGSPAVLTRIGGGRALVDLRTVPPSQEAELLGAVVAARRLNGR
jgi:L-seryl-tRNA(Ser) seleniumtransferase